MEYKQHYKTRYNEPSFYCRYANAYTECGDKNLASARIVKKGTEKIQ